MSRISEQLVGKKAILIDLDDVLLYPLYRNPIDLFRTLENCSGKGGFSDSRIGAGCAAEGQGLDAIYSKMSLGYQPVKEQELALTTLTTKVNPELQEVLQDAVQRNIAVFLCGTDIERSCNIESILERSRCDGYRKIFDCRGENALESAYHEIMRDTSAQPLEILHITSGFNRSLAENIGISTYIYDSIFRRFGQNRNSGFFAKLDEHQAEDILIPLLQSNIAYFSASDKSNDEWKRFGYRYIGIIAFEYIKHLNSIMSIHDIKNVFFASENGHCFKAAFEALYPDITAKLINVSKRAKVLSQINTAADIAPVMLRQITEDTTFGSWIALLCPSKTGDTYQAFVELFPDQGLIIHFDKDKKQIKSFLTHNERYILDEAAKEREGLTAYLTEIGLFAQASAIVDISRQGDLLLGAAAISRTLADKPNSMAFSWQYEPKISWQVNQLSNLNYAKAAKACTKNENLYLERVLSFALSEPAVSSTGNEAADDMRLTINGPDSDQARCAAVSRRILAGAIACVNDFAQLDRVSPFPATQSGAMTVCSYLRDDISQSDQTILEQNLYTDDANNWSMARPLFRQGRPVVGIVNPWPEDVSAEAEVITRMKRTAEENNLKCILLDTFGRVLTSDQKLTKKRVNVRDLSFVITTHYECAKVLNTFYYNPLWNPPEIPLNLSDYTPRVTSLFMANDDFLIYDEGGMANYLRTILMNCPRDLEGVSPLTASFPISAAMPPKLDKPIMFYCGMNWEIMFGTPGRHDGLFKLLDSTGKVEFYGPKKVEAWGGLEPWKGYDCYQGMIPFDGFSIVEKINECGICLVLSSDTHRRAGSATNRLYEACAAGAVIISDDNEFVLKNFKDAALFIRFNRNDPHDTFNQIMEKYNWILKHPEEALQMARRAQEIYLSKYSLDLQMNQIVKNHPARMRALSADLYAKDQSGKVLVTFVPNTRDISKAKEQLDVVIGNIHGQIYANIELAVAADNTLADELVEYCRTKCAAAHVVPVRLYDKKGVRALTDGQAIRKVQKTIPHDYFINTTANEIWFNDHVTALVRAAAGENCMGACSGAACEGKDGLRRFNFFDCLNVNHLYQMTEPTHPLAAGQFLFRAEAHELVPDFVFGNLDGLEHIAYAGIIKFRKGAEIGFTRRMSLCFYDEVKDKRFALVQNVMQQRFIRDILHFSVPQGTAAAAASSFDPKGISETLMWLPLKNYFLLRYYRHCMRKYPSGSSKHKKYANKYNACCKKYREFWKV